MANDLIANPIVVDTVSGATVTKPMRVSNIYWYNPATAGDLFVITDGGAAGKILHQGRAEANNQSQFFEFQPPREWGKFSVTTLGSGTLFIYLVTSR